VSWLNPLSWGRRRSAPAAAEGRRLEWLGSISALARAYESQYLAGNAAGVPVNDDTAMRHLTFYACVAFISEKLAMLPIQQTRPDERGSPEQLETRWTVALNRQANPWHTAMDVRQTMIAERLITGNAFVWVDQSGDQVALWNLPCTTRPKMSASRGLLYDTEVNGMKLTLPATDVIHFRGPRRANSLLGMSVVEQAQSSIGLGLAATEQGARFFGQGASPSLVFSTPEVLSDEVAARLRDQLQDTYGGVRNSNRVAVLEEGLTATPLSISQRDSQFLETRAYNRTEICGLFNVPPNMIGDFERATWSNSQQMDLYVAKYTLSGHAVAIEQELQSKLLVTPQQRRQSFAHDMTGLLRGDLVARTEYIKEMVTLGVMTRAEARRREGLPYIEGLDEPLTPANITGAQPPADPPADPPAPTED
jgi:HK97 family phage portal protein